MPCQAKAHSRQLGKTPHEGPRSPRCQAWASRMVGKPLPGPRPNCRVLGLAREEAEASQLRVGVAAFQPPPARMGAPAVPAAELGPGCMVTRPAVHPVLRLLSCKKHISITPHCARGCPPKIHTYLKLVSHNSHPSHRGYAAVSNSDIIFKTAAGGPLHRDVACPPKNLWLGKDV